MQIEEQIVEWKSEIQAVSKERMQAAKKRWDSLGKPIGGLGDLEQAVIRMAGIRRDGKALSLNRTAALVFCADHGVVAEGVTQTGQEVTKIVADNFAAGKTTLCVLAKQCQADVFPIDIGINCEAYQEKELQPYRVANRKVRRGTGNIKIESAMTQEECILAIKQGIRAVKEAKRLGYDAVVTGEMGIGNTTPTSVLTSILLNVSSEKVTGRGAGLSDEGLLRKRKVVAETVERLKQLGISEQAPIQLLSEAGGLEIAGMTGACIGGAIYGMPVILDGVISAVAAVLADRIDSRVRDYLFASHNSKEPAGRILLNSLGLSPLLECHMGLGEGTGGLLVVPVLRMALGVYYGMNTFDEIGVEAYESCLS